MELSILTDSVKVGIVGSRRRDSESDLAAVRTKLLEIISSCSGKEIILVSGGCPKGGDRFAEILAKELGLQIIIHYPKLDDMDPSRNRRFEFAKVAYARNTLIAEDSDILLACVAADRKGGTEDTVKKYLKFGKRNLILA